jgi:hypothetical protein
MDKDDELGVGVLGFQEGSALFGGIPEPETQEEKGGDNASGLKDIGVGDGDGSKGDKDDVRLDGDTVDTGAGDDVKGDVDYGAMLKELHQRGIIDDPGGIEYTDEDGKPVEITADNIFDVIEDLAKSKVESRFSGLSDFVRSLIEVEEKGGSVNDIIAYHKEAIVPLKDMDISTEAGQMAVLKHYYQLQGNREEDEIDTLIESFKSRNQLEGKAEKAREALEAEKTRCIEAEKVKAEKLKAEFNEFITQYRRQIGEEFKRFQLTETVRKKMIDASVNRDKDGRYMIQQLFMETWNDPSKAAELVFFLVDPKAYREHLSNGKVTDATKTIMRRVLGTKRDRRTTVGDDSGKGGDGAFEVDAPGE